jgi:voltage-gated potassium channel
MIIEGWTFVDALYMTVITISTVGFKEVNQVGEGGRIFTIKERISISPLSKRI